MDYEKLHKDTITKLQEMVNSGKITVETARGICADFIPENEDERIRKAISQCVEDMRGQFEKLYSVHHKDAIAWLEKQGKKEYALKSSKDEDVHKFVQYIERQAKAYELNLPNRAYDIYGFAKDILSWLEKQGEPKILGIGVEKARGVLKECINKIEQKPVDKVEPKFHEGEWITNGEDTWKIVKVKPLDYILQSQNGNIVDDTISFVDEYFHSFTIEDAKDGDVLVCKSGWTCIFKSLVNDETFSSYCFMDNTKWFCETGSESHTLKKEFMKAYNGDIKPATKEQRDLLFSKMKEAGYVWDAEKKELKKIKQNPSIKLELDENGEPVLTPFEAELFSMMSEAWQHYAFGKEINIAEIVKEHSVDLVALAHNQQPIMWSVEDMSKVQRICKYLEEAKKYYADLTEVRECIDWLKSLKRYTWKPTEEQINSLQCECADK